MHTVPANGLRGIGDLHIAEMTGSRDRAQLAFHIDRVTGAGPIYRAAPSMVLCAVGRASIRSVSVSISQV